MTERDKLTDIQQRAVKIWLKSIIKMELAIDNILRDIRDFNAKLENPPSYIVSGVGGYSGDAVSGGEKSSKGENYTAWLEETTNRRDYLVDKLDNYRDQVRQYQRTLKELRNHHGKRAGDIIETKYYRCIKNDEEVYKNILYISKGTFYRLHDKGLKFFYDVLPLMFIDIEERLEREQKEKGKPPT
ncbi:MAG: hypothetical protein ACYDG4_10730 [Desulfuromonadaceae bacterium]